MTRSNVELVSKMLSDFYKHISTRSSLFLALDGVLSKSLEWHFIAWKQYWTNFQLKDTRTDWMAWVQTHNTLTEIIKTIGKKTYENSPYEFLFSTAFIEEFKKHVNAKKNEKVLTTTGNEMHYKHELFRIFYSVLFQYLDESDPIRNIAGEQYFWDHFPEEWKITEETWELGVLSYNEYLSWAMSRVHQRERYDRVLQNVTKNLFPSLDFKTWSRILLFALLPYSSENRVKSIIERSWVFGYINPADPTENTVNNEKVENTFRFALLLFRNIFDEEKLNQYVTEAEGLDYTEKPDEEKRKQEFLTIFRGMLDYLQNHNEEQ